MHYHSPLVATLNELDTWVIEQSPAALCVCAAPDGRIIRYNALAVRLWGRAPDSRERFTGAWRSRSPDGRVVPVDESATALVLRGGASIRNERTIIERSDGSSAIVTTHVSPMQDDAGRLVGAISAFEETADDDAVQAADAASHQALLESYQSLVNTDAALHRVLDSALIGVWDYDLHTRRAVRSVTHDQIHGYPQPLKEWTFDTFLDHVAPEYREAIRARFEDCLAGSAGEFDCRIIRADGTPAWIWSRGRIVRDAGGSPSRLVGLVMDVTRHKAVEHTFDIERRQREAFVSTLAHELRQPLSALLAATEVMRLSSTSEVADRANAVMRRQIGQMSRVVDDLLDATRWTLGKVTLRKRHLDLREIVTEVALDIATPMAERGHELAVTVPPAPLWVCADAQRLQQVLSNLLRNAVKYTDPGGHIWVTAGRREATVFVTVKDTGRGIEPEALPHIFELFSQVRPAESSGLGIGLSVVKEIMTLHDGRVDVRSAGPGRGSEFVITLPLAVPPAGPSA